MDLSYITSSSKTSAATTNKSKVLSSSVRSDLELELLYYRLLQATYLDVKSAKSLREQEEAAKTQLHEVWEEVEKKRRECEVLRRELETAQRNAALSSVLDVQVKDLSPIVNVLPQLQQHHTALSHALDATRHELATSGVLPATEQQLEAELLRSERLLANIVTVIRHKVPTVVSFANSTEAAVNTLDKEFQELEKCWKELSTAMRLQVQETSLTFEKKQRQRHIYVHSISPSHHNNSTMIQTNMHT
jgi:chromosome segregation ATPase